MTMAFAYPVSYRLSHRAFGRMGAVGRTVTAYAVFISVSMLCFAAMTLLSLLP